MSHPLTQLTSILWVSRSQFANLNSGIIHAGDSVCLVDPGILPAEIEALADFVKMQKATSQVLILTHSHWDHLFGPEHFPGCRIIAQANYMNEVQGEAGRQIHLQVEKLTSHFEITHQQPFVIHQPQATFEETLSVSVGDHSLQLIHAPGHAADQLVIYLPDDGTLWAGDMLSDAEIPYVNCNLVAYEATLARLAGLDIAVLVPGHGAATLEINEVKTRIAADREYLANLRDQVTQSVDDGLTVAETVETCADFQHHNIEANAGAHQLNIESAYLELGGIADPTDVGWHQSFE